MNQGNLDAFSSAPAGSTELNEESLPPETELRYLGVRRPNPVSPTGWRRTDQGWEDVATWRQINRPLGEIVMRQQAREPAWLTAALAKLRQVPPLGFALLQIAAISAIVGLSRGELRDEIKPTSVSR